MRTARILITLTALSLLVAASFHSGLVTDGVPDQSAAIAETVIGSVMLIGLALTWTRPPWGRRAAIGALTFGLAGTLVGAFVIAIGVGPRTPADIIYHAILLATLIAGVSIAVRLPVAGQEALR